MRILAHFSTSVVLAHATLNCLAWKMEAMGETYGSIDLLVVQRMEFVIVQRVANSSGSTIGKRNFYFFVGDGCGIDWRVGWHSLKRVPVWHTQLCSSVLVFSLGCTGKFIRNAFGNTLQFLLVSISICSATLIYSSHLKQHEIGPMPRSEQ